MTRLLFPLLAAVLAALLLAVPTRAAFTFGGVAWGTQGAGAGQFQAVDGVAVDQAGNVFVADTGNNRIQKFTADGAFLTAWGTAGSGQSQFNAPADVAVGPDGSVYVADTGNNRIQRFNTDGVFLTAWGQAGTLEGQFNAPSGVAAGPDGSVYVADAGNNRVQRFLADGTSLGQAVGSAGAGPSQFNTMRGIAVDQNGIVYVVDAGNTRVQAFTADLTSRTTEWGTNGTGNGQFTTSVRGIATAAGNVYVSDPGSGGVQRFTSGGAFIERLDAGNSGGDTQFTTPQRVAATGAGQVYVSQGTARVARYTQQADGPTGGFDQLPPPETGETANAAPVRGTVLVKVPGSNRFEEFDAAANIPIGSLVDVRKGEIVLRTTSGPTGTQTANFFEGIFRLLQPKTAQPVTELRLEGGNFRRACRGFRVQPPPRNATAARKRVRRLWGNGSGRFRTRGRYSTASVRGTLWLTEDHCDGTLIRVREGSVTVRDFVKRKNVVVRAGKSYFVRAKPRPRRR